MSIMFARVLTILSIIASSIFILSQQNHNTFISAQSVVSVCAGGLMTCGLLDNKKVKCVGAKAAFGQAGFPSNLLDAEIAGKSYDELGNKLPYVDFGTNAKVEKLVCGQSFVCVMLDTAEIKCVGSNSVGQCGSGTSDVPIGNYTGYNGDNFPSVNLGSGLQVLDIASGIGHSCVKFTGNKIKCFGYNNFGQLGLGDGTTRGKSASDMGDNLPFLDFGIDFEVATIYTGGNAYHSCVSFSAPANATDRIKCWGYNLKFQLGYSTNLDYGNQPNDMGDNLLLVDFGSESRVKQMSMGFEFTCAYLFSNSLKCYGASPNGELGLGITTEQRQLGDSTPDVPLDSGKKIAFISAGNNFNCIVYDDQLTMKCFGQNDLAQLGQGDTNNRGNSPTNTVPQIQAIRLGYGQTKIKAIISAYNHNCVQFVDFTVKCFGWNQFYQLGLGTDNNVGDVGGEMGAGLQPLFFSLPTKAPSNSPTKSPSKSPTTAPTRPPTNSPTPPTSSPSKSPSNSPSKSPSKSPTKAPSNSPTSKPTRSPSSSPLKVPTKAPAPGLCNYITKKKCKKDKKCQWVNNICSLVNCVEFITKKDCKANKSCTWKKNECKSKA